MRLVNVTTLELVEFFEKDVPRYCILSHRWGSEEPTYKEYLKGQQRQKSGYQKIFAFCEFVRDCYNDTVKWAWIDTVCIDKSSSSELSEAINSMYLWYQKARICIVHLTDVTNGAEWQVQFEKSEWFTRGWTLQELIAPQHGVLFCDANWHVLGHTGQYFTNYEEEKECGPCLDNVVSRVTGIAHYDLIAFDPSRMGRRTSLAVRMSWASRRKTTRVEDIAYSLMGIFDVNMPLIYGERSKAFVRLQEEIMKRSIDHSIFAWRPPKENVWYGMLASSPEYFKDCSNVIEHHTPLHNTRPFQVTNKGLELRTSALQAVSKLWRSQNRRFSEFTQFAMPLNCARYHFSMVGEYKVHQIKIYLEQNLKSDLAANQGAQERDLYFRVRSMTEDITHHDWVSPDLESNSTDVEETIYVPTCLEIHVGPRPGEIFNMNADPWRRSTPHNRVNLRPTTDHKLH